MLTPLLQAARIPHLRLTVHDVLPAHGLRTAGTAPSRSTRRAKGIRGAQSITPTQYCYHLVVRVCRASATRACTTIKL